jgi:N-methylhydantoinase A
VLTSFGGAGGLHVCALAEALGMTHALVPVHAGVLSALGMLVAPPSRQLSHTLTGLLDGFTDAEIDTQLQVLAGRGRDELESEGIATDEIKSTFSLDLRYQGQSYTLNLAWQGIEKTRAAFETLHEQRYGHRLEMPVQLVTLRCGLRGRPMEIRLPAVDAVAQAEPRHVTVAGYDAPVPVFARAALHAGELLDGPALITETVATTWLPAGWRCEVDAAGNLLLERI